ASGRPLMIEEPPLGAAPAPKRLRRPPSPFAGVGPSFEGLGYDDNFTENGFRAIPPDPIGAAGTNRLVSVVNSMIEARDKSGTLIFQDALKDFYAPLGGCAILTFPFDPKVVYDHYQDRFVVVALERANAGVNPSPDNLSRILVAVSKTSSPATATSADWWFRCIDSKVPVGGIEYWADYPGFELDEEAIYVTTNMFTFPGVTSGYAGSRLWIVHKGTAGGFYAGGPATVTVHDPYVVPGGVATTTMPAEIHGAGGVAPGVGTFLVSYSGISDGTSEFVQVIRVDDPLGTIGGPFFVGPDFVSVGDLETLTASLPDAPQPGTAQRVEVNDRRALDAVCRGGTLWLTTTVVPDGAGQPALADHTTAWWIALDTGAVTSSASPAGLITLDQQGGLAGEEIAGVAGGPVYTFFPSVAVNAAGTAAFGFAACGTNVYAGAYATLRQAADPVGVTDPAATVEAGRDYYVRTFDAPPCDAAPARNRWGDYSGISVDPTDDEGFWVFNQFANVRGSPGTGGCNGRPDPEDGRWGTAWALVGTPGTAAVGETEPSGLELRALSANPGTGPARLEFELAQATRIDLSVLDVQGHRVARLASGLCSAGRHQAVWDLGQSRRRVPAGIYFVRLATPAGHRLRRLVVL
ncbi:MAG: hypothetical protein ACRENJ_03930, partial [Candidatus Eiseniibacteriota bacterium]